MLFRLGNVTNLLNVTPSNPLVHHLHPFHFELFKFKDLAAKQHPTIQYTTAHYTWTYKLIFMLEYM